MTNEYDKVCPGCHISQPADARTDLRTNLCTFCVADYNRKNGGRNG